MNRWQGWLKRVSYVMVVTSVAWGCSSDRLLTSTAPRSEVGAFPNVEMVTPTIARNLSSKGAFHSVYIFYKSTAPTDRLQRIASGGARIAGELRTITTQRVIASIVPEDRIDLVRRLPWVDSVLVASDDAAPLGDVRSWAFDTNGAGFGYVQDTLGYDGNGVKVAVIDLGVDCTFMDLLGKVKGGVDYWAGYSNGCVPMAEGSGHGSDVASVIAAIPDNNYGSVGAAPGANIYSLRVCDWPYTKCYDALMTLAVQWAMDNGMQVINLSIGNCGGISDPVNDPYLEAALQAAHDAGIVIFAGTGNGSPACSSDDPVSWMATLPSTIGIGEYFSDGSYRVEDQHGTGTDLVAPSGVWLYSYTFKQFQNLSGTSFATPQASAAAALLISAGFGGPDLIKQRLIETAKDRGAAGWDPYYGWGSIRANYAVVWPPRVVTLAVPSSPIYSAGTYYLHAYLNYGVSPIDVKWDIDYGLSTLTDIHTGWVSNSFTLSVPSGNYSITITATPRERTYHRIGSGQTKTVYVCTGGTAATSIATSSLVGPDAVYGCLPPPPPGP